MTPRFKSGTPARQHTLLSGVAQIEVYAQTHVGLVRGNNEDTFLIADLASGRGWFPETEEAACHLHLPLPTGGLCVAVADGMGGGQAGEVASRMALQLVSEYFLRKDGETRNLTWLACWEAVTQHANREIHAQSLVNPAQAGMGTTLTGVIWADGHLYVAQVGDSRAYLLGKDGLRQLTRDQTLVAGLVARGDLTPQEAKTHSLRNVILQAVGAESRVQADLSVASFIPPELLLLCSDGVTEKLSDQELAGLLQAPSSSLAETGERIIQAANDKGGEDNSTILLVAGLDVARLPSAA